MEMNSVGSFNRYTRWRRVYWIRIAIVSLLTVIFILLINHGPIRKFDVYKELTDIRIGRMNYEPRIPFIWTDTDWLPEHHRENWQKCNRDHCPTFPREPFKPIPKRIHQMYKSTDIPVRYSNYVRTWMENHPQYEYWFWSNEEIRLFMADHYPEFLNLYDSYSFNIQRSDVARYFILEKFGGIYSDLDYVSLHPLDTLIGAHSCILSHDPTEQSVLLYDEDLVVTNSIMASIPNHPLFRAVIRTLGEAKTHTESRRGKLLVQFDGRWTIYVTGPLLLTRVYEQYVSNNCCQQVWDFQAYLAPAEKLCPMIDVAKAEFFRNLCTEIENEEKAHAVLMKRIQACANLAKVDFKPKRPNDAYATHEWLHLGYQNQNSLKTVSIFDVVKPKKVHIYSKDVRVN